MLQHSGVPRYGGLGFADSRPLLADEPTAALDAESSAQLESLVLRLAKDRMPILWVTHDLAQMRRLAGHLVALERGRIHCAGAPGDYSESPSLSDCLRSNVFR
ncbi:hypothetical protein [Rhodococcus tibetensis]|uniref:Uncharacterized protein n=1 Tax=Rhodococcus tibetensis TaxID=2965064 RepID=A0ABT1QA60_9NOCA|nr:hypothetical protein [Rhodococcus sp. FXJ9.536]MCQ4119156.1 hypothetical protein [Rhodococcus sp. FXJ9.536]